MSLPKPYYEHGRIIVYNCDCREILPSLSAEAIITDPVWPKASPLLLGSSDPWRLWAECCAVIHRGFQRLVVQLGGLSDPRFLAPVPSWLPYIRTCWLEYLPPSFSGRCVLSADVAYCFGSIPANLPARRCIPGVSRANAGNSDYRWKEKSLPHPASRRLAHVRWLCKWFGGGSVVDPFAGSGTTGVACKSLGIPCTLIEIEEKYCALAVRRLSQEVLELEPVTPYTDDQLALLSRQDEPKEEALEGGA